MVLALGTFLIMFVGTYSAPIIANYVTECFPELALEMAVIRSVYWHIFGPGLPLFIIPEKARVSLGW